MLNFITYRCISVLPTKTKSWSYKWLTFNIIYDYYIVCKHVTTYLTYFTLLHMQCRTFSKHKQAKITPSTHLIFNRLQSIGLERSRISPKRFLQMWSHLCAVRRKLFLIATIKILVIPQLSAPFSHRILKKKITKRRWNRTNGWKHDRLKWQVTAVKIPRRSKNVSSA